MWVYARVGNGLPGLVAQSPGLPRSLRSGWQCGGGEPLCAASRERLRSRSFAGSEQLWIAIVTWIELTYDRPRRWKRLSGLTPVSREHSSSVTPFSPRDDNWHRLVRQAVATDGRDKLMTLSPDDEMRVLKDSFRGPYRAQAACLWLGRGGR